MIFNSLTFVLFLLLVIPLYWALPQRGRLWLIFIASLIFYGFWRVEFIFIMMITPLVDFYFAHRIVKEPDRNKQRLLLIVSIILNLGLLVYFKYLMFFADSWNSIADMAGLSWRFPHLNIILPIGISFYTFHTMSFIIDTYRGFVRPPKDFITYGCYVFFFPQLVAGPILRVGEVVSQLEAKQTYKHEHIAYGLKRILFGLFLKVGLADNIAPFVDDGFAQDLGSLGALDVWTLAFMFGFQIYFDFSAYSSIAIGAARLMGIRFPENFNHPYTASNPKEFWKRWHISLSSWIRDYLYLPLAGQKVVDRYNSKSEGGLPTFRETEKVSKTFVPLFLTWAIMGLWHGANWTFVFWGVYHAILVLGHRVLQPITRHLSPTTQRWGGWVLTLPFIMLSWIPFRAESMKDVGVMFSKLIQPSQYLFLGMRENIYLLAAVLMASTLLSYFVEAYLWPSIRKKEGVSLVFETLAYTFALVVVIIFLRPISQFIYFQF